jgi:acyl-coenzyme A thioesterase PaaI-like protein
MADEAWDQSGLGEAVVFLGDVVSDEIRRSEASPLRYRIAGTIKELNRLVLEADAPASDFQRAGELLEEARELLAPHPLRQPDRWEASAVSGKFNAFAPPLIADMSPSSKVFRCRTTMGTGWSGPDGVVHGGVLAKIMDMCFGAAGGLNGTPGVTGTITVRYERPTPLGAELVFESWVDRLEGRKVFVAGHVLHAGVPTVTATGTMIRMRPVE